MTLPRIVRFLETSDAPGSSCPHCGAEGRYILRFRVEDGRELGAMRGCVKLFPSSLIAHEDLRLRDKEIRLKKSYGPQAALNRADRAAMDAIEAFYAGAGSERTALSLTDSAKCANARKYR